MGEDKRSIEERVLARYHVLLSHYIRLFVHPPLGSLEDKFLQFHLTLQAKIDIMQEEMRKEEEGRAE